MVNNRVKELTKKIELESKKLDNKIKAIEKIKLSITKDLKKNVKELKTKQLQKLQDEKKNITEKVKDMKTNLFNAKKEITGIKINKKIDVSKKIQEEQSDKKKSADKNIKKIMNMMAAYNRNANRELIEILKSMEEEELKKETGAYYKSIFGIFNHILQFDIHFFKVCRKYSSKKVIPNEKLFDSFDDYEYYNLDDLEILIDIREKLDEIIITIINSIDNFNVSGKVVIRNNEIKKSRYHLIMYAFNHSTHHRGEISVLLDQMGYKNDFSSFLNII